jgi:hypothetical protein
MPTFARHLIERCAEAWNVGGNSRPNLDVIHAML